MVLSPPSSIVGAYMGPFSYAKVEDGVTREYFYRVQSTLSVHNGNTREYFSRRTARAEAPVRTAVAREVKDEALDL